MVLAMVDAAGGGLSPGLCPDRSPAGDRDAGGEEPDAAKDGGTVMSKPTPGPWIVFSADADGANDVLPAMRPGHIAIDIASVADARLIAAAPALLAALKEGINIGWLLSPAVMADNPKDVLEAVTRWLDQARAAIAKATQP